MGEKKEKTIYINWHGPFSYDKIISKEKNLFKNKGLYQIYASHHVYGEDTLVYIGKTEKAFSQRLKDRDFFSYGKDLENIKVYLGVIYSESIYKQVDFSTDLKDAESLLINYHSPAKNSSNINSYGEHESDITVINRGNYRMLHQAVSTKAYYHDELAFEQVDELMETLNVNEELEDIDDNFYGFYLNNERTLWLGLDYSIWMNDTVLVFQAKEKLNDLFKETIDPEWYYKELRGDEEDIIEEIKSYMK